MDVKIFGFVGIESHDIIYYSARMATKLGYSALMVDLSEDKSLACLYQGDYSKGEFVDVNGVSLVYGELGRGYLSNHDYIFIYYGYTKTYLDLCHEIYFVSTFQRNHINRLKGLSVPNVPRFLIVRERYLCSVDLNYILEELKYLGIAEDDIWVLEDTDTDRAAKVYLQHSRKVKLNKLSDSMKELVSHLYDIDESKKNIEKAWKSLKKG